MKSYANSVTSANYTHPSDRLWMVQTHWQTSAASITLGTLHLSSILKDEASSRVNDWVSRSILNSSFDRLNIVEVDHVCDGGKDIYNSLQVYNNNLKI